ncbi:MAG: hypothetical protein IKC51_07555 [Myxococcaceae bacterium]|nr:hypothetical protein [Myxococcaceae bacterium]
MKKIENEHGAAAVEVAILSLVMVPMVMYAIFFFDLSLMHIKILEASRYSVWELIATENTNWKAGTHSIQSQQVQNELDALWGDDMNSATSNNSDYNKHAGIFNEKVSGLSVTTLENEGENSSSDSIITATWTDDLLFGDNIKGEKDVDETELNSENDSEGIIKSIMDKVLEFSGQGANFFYNRFGLNSKGFVKTTVSSKLYFKRTAPIFGDTLLPDDVFDFSANQKLLVDDWRLYDGDDVDYGENSTKNEAYYAQVKRMFFLGVFKDIGDFLKDTLDFGGGDDGKGLLSKFLNKIQSAIGIDNPFTPTVRSYALKGSTADTPDTCASGTGCVTMDVVNPYCSKNKRCGARTSFYTNVVRDTWSWQDSNYYKVYQRQSNSDSSSYYMGCPKSQVINRADCWQN